MDINNIIKYKTGAEKDMTGRIAKGRFDLISPIALERIAMLYAKGAEKYEDRNWEQGIPFSQCIDSLLRHANQYRMGMRDEDHIAAVAWWAFAIMHFEFTNPYLDDLPYYTDEFDKRKHDKEIKDS